MGLGPGDLLQAKVLDGGAVALIFLVLLVRRPSHAEIFDALRQRAADLLYSGIFLVNGIRDVMLGCSAQRQSSSGSSVCLRKATTAASSATDNTVEHGCVGPVGKSATEVRFFHFVTVF